MKILKFWESKWCYHNIFFNPLLSFGKPGVEFYGQHKNHDSSVIQLVFLPNEVSHS